MQTIELEPAAREEQKGIEAILEKRFSPYAFSARSVEPEKLRKLFRAAQSAPSSYNEQPWRFVVAARDDPEAFERLLAPLMEMNREWARHAPVLVLSVAKRDFTHNGQPNRHAMYDVGQAAAYLTLQATELGLYVHQMAGFDAAKARQVLDIPEDYEPAAMMAMGYPGDPESLAEGLRQQDKARRPRKPLASLFFEGTWDKPLSQAAGNGSTMSTQ